MYFESASAAAMIYVPFGGIQQSLSINPYADGNGQPLPVHRHVEAIAIGASASAVFLMTNDHLFRVPLDRDGKTESTEISPIASGRFVAQFIDGAVAGFHSSPQFAIPTILTQYRRIMCVAPMQELFLCGVLGSGVIQLLTVHGHECRSFVGHCAPVMRIACFGPSTFALSADDSTVRLGDVRDRFPVVSVTSNRVSIVSIAESDESDESDEVLEAALHNKTVNVFDLKNAGRPLLSVPTQDYEAANLQYNQQGDLPAMFGIVEKEGSKDSMMFVDNEGQSRQRIFRLYEKFVAPP
jgi:hypothetical protein